MGCFVAATQGWMLTRSRWYETVALFLICFTLFRPGFWLDQIFDPYVNRPAADLVQVANDAPLGSTIRFRAKSQTRAGDEVDKIVRLTLREGATGPERLRAAGFSVMTLGDRTQIGTVRFGSQATQYGLAAGDEITAVMTPADRPSRFWLFIPALVLLAGIVVLQRRRQQLQPATAG